MAGAHNVIIAVTVHLKFVCVVWHHLLYAKGKQEVDVEILGNLIKISTLVDGRTLVFFLPWEYDIVASALLGFLQLY